MVYDHNTHLRELVQIMSGTQQWHTMIRDFAMQITRITTYAPHLAN
jgi:hypothetical protein